MELNQQLIVQFFKLTVRRCSIFFFLHYAISELKMSFWISVSCQLYIKSWDNCSNTNKPIVSRCPKDISFYLIYEQMISPRLKIGQCPTHYRPHGPFTFLRRMGLGPRNGLFHWLVENKEILNGGQNVPTDCWRRNMNSCVWRTYGGFRGDSPPSKLVSIFRIPVSLLWQSRFSLTTWLMFSMKKAARSRKI